MKSCWECFMILRNLKGNVKILRKFYRKLLSEFRFCVNIANNGSNNSTNIQSISSVPRVRLRQCMPFPSLRLDLLQLCQVDTFSCNSSFFFINWAAFACGKRWFLPTSLAKCWTAMYSTTAFSEQLIDASTNNWRKGMLSKVWQQNLAPRLFCCRYSSAGFAVFGSSWTWVIASNSGYYSSPWYALKRM